MEFIKFSGNVIRKCQPSGTKLQLKKDRVEPIILGFTLSSHNGSTNKERGREEEG